MNSKFNFILVAVIITAVQLVQAQINAITDTGDEVLLYTDGTWKYMDGETLDASEIPVNDQVFLKDKNSKFLVKSTKMNVGIWINPKEWSFSKAGENEDAEFNFLKKGEDLYAILISEKVEIPVETLKDIALENARSVAPDIKIDKQEYRTVNGKKVFMMQMSGSIQGMSLKYMGYYYSNENGTMQLLTYTGGNLFDSYEKDIELFLNGLVEL